MLWGIHTVTAVKSQVDASVSQETCCLISTLFWNGRELKSNDGLIDLTQQLLRLLALLVITHLDNFLQD